mmetsp:Transcript_52494/g.145566  ORF Transcript_52494/g.145566 Transcript_52494/m.145566 type:complete len:258 (-) Transcript_52494:969-1742(-)
MLLVLEQGHISDFEDVDLGPDLLPERREVSVSVILRPALAPKREVEELFELLLREELVSIQEGVAPHALHEVDEAPESIRGVVWLLPEEVPGCSVEAKIEEHAPLWVAGAGAQLLRPWRPQLPSNGSMVKLFAGVDEQGPHIKALGCQVHCLLHVSHGQGYVLEDLLHEGEPPDTLCRRELHKGHIQGQQPPKEVAEKWVVPVRDHELDHPEDGACVPQDVVPYRHELFSRLAPLCVAFHVLVPPGLVPPCEGVHLG